MKSSSVLKQIEEKPARLFKELWRYYGVANYLTRVYENKDEDLRVVLSDSFTLNDLNLIQLIQHIVYNWPGEERQGIPKNLGLYLYDKYKERIHKYFDKKWQEHHKEWLANDKRDKRQLFQEAVLRGFTVRDTIKFKKGRWYIKFHLGQLYYPKSFKNQSSALKFREGIGIIGYTGAEQCLK